MATKNATPTVFDRISSGELISIPAAMKRLEITSAGAFQAALKSHEYLKAAIVEKTDIHKRLIESAAVEKYFAERGTRGSRDGNKWYSARVSDDLADALRNGDWDKVAELAPNGIEIVKPTDRAKKAAENGVESADVVSESHYLEGDDDNDDE